MKYIAIATPPPIKVGEVAIGDDVVVPDQAMSLREILERFTRNESLPIGLEVRFHESQDDLEKLRDMDPVDRDIFLDELKAKQKAYQAQEEAKKKAAVDAEIKRRADEATARQSKNLDNTLPTDTK